MGRPAKTLAPPASKSPERMELEELAAKLSDAATVDAWQNGNGFCVCVEAVRPNKKVIRIIVEGASSAGNAERVCRDAARSMLGGAQ